MPSPPNCEKTCPSLLADAGLGTLGTNSNLMPWDEKKPNKPTTSNGMGSVDSMIPGVRRNSEGKFLA
jgi:hypothetical protein